MGKMICSQTKCRHKTCVCRVPHEPSEACDRVNKVCKPCVPVRPRRKPVTAWLCWYEKADGSFMADHFYVRRTARHSATMWRRSGWTVRGPVKVVVP